MLVICSDCGIDEEVPEPVMVSAMLEEWEMTMSDYFDNFICDQCAGDTVVCLSSTTNLHARSDCGTIAGSSNG